MTAAWISIALLVLGVPLMAWWIGSRRFWGRLEKRAADDPAVAIMRRHGLSTGQAAAVVNAVTSGRALEDPRQRAAAVELAQLTVHQLFPSWEQASVTRRIVRVVGAVWVLVAVAGLVSAVATGRLGDVNWFSVIFVLGGVAMPFVASRRLRRAVVLNSAGETD
jgi:hypothetical protein